MSPSPSPSSDTSTVTAEQFADFAYVTHVLLAVLVLAVVVFVIGSFGTWSRQGG